MIGIIGALVVSKAPFVVMNTGLFILRASTLTVATPFVKSSGDSSAGRISASPKSDRSAVGPNSARIEAIYDRRRLNRG